MKKNTKTKKKKNSLVVFTFYFEKLSQLVVSAVLDYPSAWHPHSAMRNESFTLDDQIQDPSAKPGSETD